MGWIKNKFVRTRPQIITDTANGLVRAVSNDAEKFNTLERATILRLAVSELKQQMVIDKKILSGKRKEINEALKILK